MEDYNSHETSWGLTSLIKPVSPHRPLGMVVTAGNCHQVDSLVRHLDIGLHTTVGVHAAVAPMEVHTGLGLRTLVCT